MSICFGHQGFFIFWSVCFGHQGIPQKFHLNTEKLNDLDNIEEIVSLLEGKVISKLDSLTIQLLNDYDDVGGDAEFWAQSILALYGYYYPPKYENAGSGNNQLASPYGGLEAMVNKVTYILLKPNPANNYVDFSVKDLGKELKALLQVQDIQGKVVFEHTIASFENIQWEVRNNSSGIYFYQVILEGEVLQSGKIIVEK